MSSELNILFQHLSSNGNRDVDRIGQIFRDEESSPYHQMFLLLRVERVGWRDALAINEFHIILLRLTLFDDNHARLSAVEG